ncbi:hypothetical protein ILUMI_17831 [Ignelater luminosus]|uniref:Serpin domain-containing protein n=1 Tax=Ignelater luminosus TaxID=2038154 RepID=A0A8K0G7I8_IGNLU|nr:hypothetical protein ILUMI_17831 [Ignelater luminosus]
MKNFPFKEEFNKSAVEALLPEAVEINFKNNTEAAKRINEWVDNKTDSRIKDLVSFIKALSECQSGIREQHSTESALQLVVEDWRQALDRGEATVEVFIEHSKP